MDSNSMMDMEDVKQFLSNLYENYLTDTKQYVQKGYRAKCLGAMEALLVVLGKLTPGVPHDLTRLEYDRIFKLFWLIPITIPMKETYEAMILRLTKQTIDA